MRCFENFGGEMPQMPTPGCAPVSTKQILCYQTQDVERGKRRNHTSHAVN